MNREVLLESIMSAIDEFSYIKVDEIPDMPLYMDQVTTLMEQKLKTTSRCPDEDKILTKTMINNYAKNHLLPPPDKKKYSKDHILVLIFIYYYKGFLSIADIQSLLKPMTETFFGEESSLAMSEIYEEILSQQKLQVDDLKKDVEEKLTRASVMFTERPDEEAEFLQLFSFISLLSFDVYFKKLMIERITDTFLKKEDAAKKSE